MNAAPRSHRDRPGYQRVMANPSKFNLELFKAIAQDLKTGRIPRKQFMVTDPLTTGLRVIIRASGAISYHVHYTIGDSRPLIDIGEEPEMTIARARPIARTITALAAKGVDPRAGLHERLVKEIEAKGEKWKP